jgi:hypothetical protein
MTATSRHQPHSTRGDRASQITRIPRFTSARQRTVTVLTDTGYVRTLGYQMPNFEQTGSNFGADLQHETPFLVEVGRGTTVADGAILINADYSSTEVVMARKPFHWPGS